jgi:hypothetical protein
LFLGDLDLEPAAFFLQTRETPAVFAQSRFAFGDPSVQPVSLALQFGGLRADDFAFVLKALDFATGFGGFGFALDAAVVPRFELVPAVFDQLAEFLDALFERDLLPGEGGAVLFLACQGHFDFGERGLGLIALLAQGFQSFGNRGHTVPGRLFLPGQLIDARGQGGTLLQALLFLGGEALNLINDGIDLLCQRALGILQGIELALACGNLDLLGAEFNLGLLHFRLKRRVFA